MALTIADTNAVTLGAAKAEAFAALDTASDMVTLPWRGVIGRPYRKECERVGK